MAQINFGGPSILALADVARYAAARRSTLASMAVNSALSALQIVVGYFGRSQALLADGIHTLSDLMSDFLVLFASRRSAAAADDEHPYGHRRIETAATLLLGVALTVIGLGILWRAGLRLTSGAAFTTVHPATLWIALATLASKETLYHYLMRVARAQRSQMLAANAWHTRADAATSLIGAIGISGNLLGYAFLDSLAAALVAFFIARMGVKLGYQALSELVDTGVEAGELAAIRRTLRETPGVRGLHELRTRRMAGQALVDAHVLVDPRISVSEGHYIAESARQRVLAGHDVLDVMVHIDPEDDAAARPSAHLPGREELVAHLRERLRGALPEPQRTVFHYLDGKVEAELFLGEGGSLEDKARLEQMLQERLKDDPYFRAVQLHRSGAP
ncbi:MAG TPA: cation diffusion facilitator family transporter [Burkholderiales bacterium]|nr:cation diffusion facilitator family transporter [Burkholderiales bacterium]